MKASSRGAWWWACAKVIVIFIAVFSGTEILWRVEQARRMHLSRVFMHRESNVESCSSRDPQQPAHERLNFGYRWASERARRTKQICVGCACQVDVRQSVYAKEIANCLLLVKNINADVVQIDPHPEKLANSIMIFDRQ